MYEWGKDSAWLCHNYLLKISAWNSLIKPNGSLFNNLIFFLLKSVQTIATAQFQLFSFFQYTFCNKNTLPNNPTTPSVFFTIPQSFCKSNQILLRYTVKPVLTTASLISKQSKWLLQFYRRNLWTTTTSEQRPLFKSPRDGRCTRVQL
jgi:hypothetical protein